MKYYVSVSGNDSNDGSFNAPFKTLDCVRDAAKNAIEDVEIEISGGRYFFDK